MSSNKAKIMSLLAIGSMLSGDHSLMSGPSPEDYMYPEELKQGKRRKGHSNYTAPKKKRRKKK